MICDLVHSGIAVVRRGSGSTTADEKHRRLRNAYLDTDQATGTVLVTVDPQKPAKALPIYASLREVSTLFDMTDDQNTAFSIIGEALLQSIADLKSDTTPDELHNLREAHQRTLFLFGLAGSGKSFVIRAWIALAESWNHPNAVRTCAPTYNAPLNLRDCAQDSDDDPEAKYCPTVVINNAIRQALYEVRMASIRMAFMHVAMTARLFSWLTCQHQVSPARR